MGNFVQVSVENRDVLAENFTAVLRSLSRIPGVELVVNRVTTGKAGDDR